MSEKKTVDINCVAMLHTSSVKERRFGETLPVRIPIRMNERIRFVSKVSGLCKSDIIRLALNIGLPQIEVGKIKAVMS